MPSRSVSRPAIALQRVQANTSTCATACKRNLTSAFFRLSTLNERALALHYREPMNLAITKAITLVGARALATAMQCSLPFVRQMALGQKQVPAYRCPAVERITGGEVLCNDLRPDIEWHRDQTGKPTGFFTRIN